MSMDWKKNEKWNIFIFEPIGIFKLIYMEESNYEKCRRISLKIH